MWQPLKTALLMCRFFMPQSNQYSWKLAKIWYAIYSYHSCLYVCFYHSCSCQDALIEQVIDKEHHKNIAKNKALKENVFMMIVCIENRIPLFLVGKPGSSKSLSKSLVDNATKGRNSKQDSIFSKMKKVCDTSQSQSCVDKLHSG